MKRVLKAFRAASIAAAVSAAVAFLLVEFLVVKPVLADARATIVAADADEKLPPEQITQLVLRSLGNRFKFVVARQLLLGHDQGYSGSRPLREFILALALPIHFSRQELSTIYLASAYMGPGVRGFAIASQRYFGRPLSVLSVYESARLFAIAYSPSAYLNGNSELLERRVQFLLEGTSP